MHRFCIRHIYQNNIYQHMSSIYFSPLKSNKQAANTVNLSTLAGSNINCSQPYCWEWLNPLLSFLALQNFAAYLHRQVGLLCRYLEHSQSLHSTSPHSQSALQILASLPSFSSLLFSSVGLLGSVSVLLPAPWPGNGFRQWRKSEGSS